MGLFAWLANRIGHRRVVATCFGCEGPIRVSDGAPLDFHGAFIHGSRAECFDYAAADMRLTMGTCTHPCGRIGASRRACADERGNFSPCRCKCHARGTF